MWRIITIGRGLRSVRPSQYCPQDPSDEISIYQHNDEVSKVYAATLRHCSVASSWSPLTVTRYNNVLKQTTFSVTQPKECHDSVDSGADGPYNRGCCQRWPPWHWHVLQDNKVLEECCTDQQEKEKEKQSQEDGGNTWQYQEWKEILQASPTLHTLGLGSAAALTLSLYRNWSELYPCPHQAKDQQNGKSNGTNKKYDLKNSFPEEKGQKNDELFWSNCMAFKNFFNAQVHSKEITSDTVEKDCTELTHKVPNHPSNTVVHKLQGIKSAENEAPGSTIPVYSLQGKALDLAKAFFNIKGNVEKKHELEEIYEDTLKSENESLLYLQSEKSNQTDRTDSGCLSDIHKDFQPQINTESTISKDEYNENKERNARSSLSAIDTEMSVSIEPAVQVEVSNARNEDTQGFTSCQESKRCVDAAKLKSLHDTLFEFVKADREDQFREVFKKDENTLWDTKPEEAVVYFQAGVMMGDPSSAFNLALCYHMGYGITQDLEKARKLYEAAAAARHGWAMYNLAVMLSQGLGGPCVPQRIHSLLQQAANMGITEAVEALSARDIGKQKQDIITYQEPQLQKCYSASSLGSSLTKHQSYSHSADDLQYLLDEDDCTDSRLSIDICKNK